MPKSLANFEQILGYKFQNPALLERAVTHRSWAFEKVALGAGEEARNLQNESLEFVGDSVLGLAVAEQLYNMHPKASEGDLTLMKHRLVSTVMLAKVSKIICLGDYMRVGRGEEKTGGRRKEALLADTLEAVIGGRAQFSVASDFLFFSNHFKITVLCRKVLLILNRYLATSFKIQLCSNAPSLIGRGLSRKLRSARAKKPAICRMNRSNLSAIRCWV
jgi:hypothetical protein